MFSNQIIAFWLMSAVVCLFLFIVMKQGGFFMPLIQFMPRLPAPTKVIAYRVKRLHHYNPFALFRPHMNYHSIAHIYSDMIGRGDLKVHGRSYGYVGFVG